METVEEAVSSRDATFTTLSGLFLAFILGVSAGAPSHVMRVMVCDGVAAVFLALSIPLLLRHVVRTRVRRQQYDFAFRTLLAIHTKRIADLHDELSRNAIEEARRDLRLPGPDGLTAENLGVVAAAAMKKMQPSLEKLSQDFERSVKDIGRQYLVSRLTEKWSGMNFVMDVIARKCRYWFFGFGLLFFVVSVLFHTGLLSIIIDFGRA